MRTQNLFIFIFYFSFLMEVQSHAQSADRPPEGPPPSRERIESRDRSETEGQVCATCQARRRSEADRSGLHELAERLSPEQQERENERLKQRLLRRVRNMSCPRARNGEEPDSEEILSRLIRLDDQSREVSSEVRDAVDEALQDKLDQCVANQRRNGNQNQAGANNNMPGMNDMSGLRSMMAMSGMGGNMMMGRGTSSMTSPMSYMNSYYGIGLQNGIYSSTLPGLYTTYNSYQSYPYSNIYNQSLPTSRITLGSTVLGASYGTSYGATYSR